MSNIIQPIITTAGLNSIMSKNELDADTGIKKGKVSFHLQNITHIEIGNGGKKLNQNSRKLTHKLASISLHNKKQAKGYHYAVVVKDTDFEDKVPEPCFINEIGYFIGDLLFAVYSSIDPICEKNKETDLILTFNLELIKDQILGDITQFIQISKKPKATETSARSEDKENYEECHTRCITSAHNLIDGDLVYISHENKKEVNIFESFQAGLISNQETRYSGTYKIFNCSENSFDILENFSGTTTRKWKTNKFIFKDQHNIPISEDKKHPLLGQNIIKIHSQDEFDAVFNRGEGTKILENTTIILSPPPKSTIDENKLISTDAREASPAYLLTNSIHLLSNTQILGFNTNSTLVLKGSDDLQIIIKGTEDNPIKGIELDGWSFDGQSNLNKTERRIVKNGGAFYLDHAENCHINCKIINHKSSGNGGGIFGTESAKYIIANNIYHNEAINGNSVFGCSKSIFRVINSNLTSYEEDLKNIIFTDNRNISVNIDLFENISVDPHDIHSISAEEIITLKKVINTNIPFENNLLKASETHRGIAKITSKSKFCLKENDTDLSSNEILYEQIKKLGLNII